MAKFIKVRVECQDGVEEQLINIKAIQRVCHHGGRHYIIDIINDSYSIFKVLDSIDEIHALIQAAQAEPPLVDYIPGDEPVTAVDLAQLTAEQKADALADCLAGLPSI